MYFTMWMRLRLSMRFWNEFRMTKFVVKSDNEFELEKRIMKNYIHSFFIHELLLFQMNIDN